MRIGINALALVPGASGGDGTYVRELVRHLAILDRANSYVVFVANWNRHLFDALPPNFSVESCGLANSSPLARICWEQLRFPRLLRRAGLDLLHCPVNVAPLRAIVPLVLTLLEAEPFMPESRIPSLARLYWRLFRRASARKASRIIAISTSSAAELVRYMGIPPQKITTVHLGVDRQRFRPSAQPLPFTSPPGGPERETDQPPASSRSPVPFPYILWIGQTFPRKNLPRLIRAFALLRQTSDLPHRLLLLGVKHWGHGEVAALLQEPRLRELVRFLGWVPDELLLAYYRHATLFVYPSLHEGFGLPALEAMASGVPVIVSNRAALPEIVGDAALLVDPLSVQSICDAMHRVLTQPCLRDELIGRGLRRAAELSWIETARNTIAVYETAASASTPAT